ncbi:MAG: 2-oxoacid:acceptor oxidoreductase family protein [Pseudomonadota bacterium]|nr:2-oxoacid:acceptor oxidoreductase family protein [Pseudomonadota bacterium]MBU3901686.1 2-oxoacid:acceptor oxidoreductase family protein [Patescibacteria group bacterium]MBU4143216.1 2-oxoacid:acceptor oxidoreductase family protein [Patescibacteria group bacterium]
MKKERYEVILAGSGGQGLGVSGIMLAEAAIVEGKNVVQTVSYGIATRGGFSMAEVIIDREEIIFQQVQHADVVLALTEEAMEKFQSLAGSGTEIFYDTTLLKERQGERLYGHPFTDMASRIGHVGMANTIALGCMAQRKSMVTADSLAEVIRKRFSGHTLEMNLQALEAGKALAAR